MGKLVIDGQFCRGESDKIREEQLREIDLVNACFDKIMNTLCQRVEPRTWPNQKKKLPQLHLGSNQICVIKTASFIIFIKCIRYWPEIMSSPLGFLKLKKNQRAGHLMQTPCINNLFLEYQINNVCCKYVYEKKTFNFQPFKVSWLRGWVICGASCLIKPWQCKSQLGWLLSKLTGHLSLAHLSYPPWRAWWWGPRRGSGRSAASPRGWSNEGSCPVNSVGQG